MRLSCGLVYPCSDQWRIDTLSDMSYKGLAAWRLTAMGLARLLSSSVIRYNRFCLLLACAAIFQCVGCAGFYIPVGGVGRDSNGDWAFFLGGGGGVAGAGGLGASCAGSCFGNPDGQACRSFRAQTKQTCGIDTTDPK